MSDRFEKTISGTLALVAIVMSVAFVHREYGAGGARVVRTEPKPPERVAVWKELVAAGVLVGDNAARVKVVEFGDFECPFCRRFELAYRAARKKFGTDVALVFVSYPLPMHRFATPAARAAGCAYDQGKFAEFHDAVFDRQDSLGLKSWGSYAHDAGIPDTARFNKCNGATGPIAQVATGQALATKLGVRATPTVIINGWRFPVPPDDTTLVQVITAALAGDQQLEAFATKRR